jgi:hypothetical protein
MNGCFRSGKSFLGGRSGEEYDYFFLVTNTELPSERVVISYEKRGNAENYIKEAKYDMAVGHLLLKSFWAKTQKSGVRVKPCFR